MVISRWHEPFTWQKDSPHRGVPRGSRYLVDLNQLSYRYAPQLVCVTYRVWLNGKKCKEMVIDFLHYKSTTLSPLMIDGTVIDRVQSYKLLGLHISNDLTWNSHCETAYKKAVKRLYGLRVLKKAGMSTGDLVSVYCLI